jgi:hypothetical protein
VLKSHLRIYAILIPLVIIARYTLFKDAREFKIFASTSVTYVAPLAIVLAIVAIAAVLFVIIKKVDNRLQQRLINVLFWGSAISLTISITAVFAYVKLSA